MLRHVEYVSEARAAVRQIWEGAARLKSLRREWHALNYAQTLTIDPAHAHAGISPAQVSSAVFDAADALAVVLDGDHKTNFARLL